MVWWVNNTPSLPPERLVTSGEGEGPHLVQSLLQLWKFTAASDLTSQYFTPFL